MFTGKDWTFEQDGQDCPWSDTETKPNPRRHFLKSPVRKLLKNGWAQITAIGSKKMYPGSNEKNDSYPVKGRVPRTLATSAGDFKELFQIDEVAEESPF